MSLLVNWRASFRYVQQQRRLFSDIPRTGGRKMESIYSKLSQSAEGKAAIERYGQCLDKNMDNVSKDCCKIEFAELQRVFQTILEAERKNKIGESS